MCNITMETMNLANTFSGGDGKSYCKKSQTCSATRYKSVTTATLYFTLICGFLLGCEDVSGTITVISQITNESVVVMADEAARYVPDRVSFYGTQGFVVYANPSNACSTVDPPPGGMFNDTFNWILVARRFDCNFEEKILNAQNAGYTGIIIHNVGSNATAPIYVAQPQKLSIYASFIGEYYGELLRDKFSFPNPYFIRIEDDFTLNGYFLPFAIVVGVCFAVMLLFMVRLLWQQVTRWARERRRSRRLKLPSSALKKLPVTKWTKGDPYETCAVCLEDFIEQDKVRVLPCSHGYHTLCIDPWLTKGRRVCPICKRKVILADENFPDSDTDTEDESAPLLRGASTSTAANPVTSGSTFVQQQENPFRRAQRRAQYQGLRGHPSRPYRSDSDSSSTGSSDSQGSRSHRSLPVLAEVHGASLGQSSTEVPQGSRAPFPSLQTRPSSILNSRSSSDEIVVNVLQPRLGNPDQTSATDGAGNIDDDVRFEGATLALEIAESDNPSGVADNVSSSSSTSSASNRNAIV